MLLVLGYHHGVRLVLIMPIQEYGHVDSSCGDVEVCSEEDFEDFGRVFVPFVSAVFFFLDFQLEGETASDGVFVFHCTFFGICSMHVEVSCSTGFCL